ncbi:G-patch RNA-binding protein, involved in splicing [Schizosaccharomyces osmophilus]|uniref:G-patch RNA-binding protein, involved in splicing n=1 Tax=Schizosaccharomyces osmophilus TaxID=2545709 RepID=A0AAE9WAP7_9SCHI|nr:G-patch RNA-binding protein, involved in splicing [Schizosaccharomyces osmophilus]WBW72415.1 G-patch RNA-binding protein, involved in splicing [Schizosaccharomyces osmophilus]
MSSVITQAQEAPIVAADTSCNYEQVNPKIQLFVRGVIFELFRNELLSLPESVLMCLFPRGLMLDYEIHDYLTNNRPLIFQTADFDPSIFGYIISYFRMMDSRINDEKQFISPPAPSFPGKCGIIFLKEDIEFYVLPPSVQQSIVEAKPIDLARTKQKVAQQLLQEKRIFDCLRVTSSTPEDSAEKNLVRMLCYSGFNEDDEWKLRTQEPHRACITSVTLTNLDFSADKGPVSDPNYFPVFQKLLLFWQKPARKCWWDSALKTNFDGIDFSVWVRRVWTLELAVLGSTHTGPLVV